MEVVVGMNNYLMEDIPNGMSKYLALGYVKQAAYLSIYTSRGRLGGSESESTALTLCLFVLCWETSSAFHT